jgi:hypothetical protein
MPEVISETPVERSYSSEELRSGAPPIFPGSLLAAHSGTAKYPASKNPSGSAGAGIAGRRRSRSPSRRLARHTLAEGGPCQGSGSPAHRSNRTRPSRYATDARHPRRTGAQEGRGEPERRKQTRGYQPRNRGGNKVAGAGSRFENDPALEDAFQAQACRIRRVGWTPPGTRPVTPASACWCRDLLIALCAG